ncbi:single-stranded DNA-binding protein [Dyadobacter diqingensis]|uniref:single-stranded DNA-binding protein n=1 Tax=Dyadobacter diqingensis TaxID=2938121 RepID=UPI0020C19EBE|nr:single-stranded DNA-binding protein [Dyadobacter diqingensis]
MEIVARITSDATVAKTKSGKEVVSFTVAINDYYKPKDGQGVQLTTFVRCAYWVSTAVAGRLLKGVLVQLSGRLGVEAFISKSGEPVGVITCRVSSIKLHAKSGAGTSQGAVDAAPANDDDLPF